MQTAAEKTVLDYLSADEKRLLLKPLVSVIKKFYENPANQKAYKEWEEKLTKGGNSNANEI